MKLKLGAALAAMGCAFSLGIEAAKASTITTFDVSATFDSSCPGCSLGGSFQIDTGTTGDVQPTTVNITMSGQPGVGPFTHYDGASGVGNSVIHLTFDDTLAHTLNLYVPVPGPFLTFVGYTGGPICGSAATCGSPLALVPSNVVSGNTVWVISAGSLTAETAAPLPAALPLFATGLGTLGLLGWRRRRKGAAGAVA